MVDEVGDDSRPAEYRQFVQSLPSRALDYLNVVGSTSFGYQHMSVPRKQKEPELAASYAVFSEEEDPAVILNRAVPPHFLGGSAAVAQRYGLGQVAASGGTNEVTRQG